MLVSSLAEGANWVKLGGDEKQVDYFDADTISRNGNIVKFWNKLNMLRILNINILYLISNLIVRTKNFVSFKRQRIC